MANQSQDRQSLRFLLSFLPTSPVFSSLFTLLPSSVLSHRKAPGALTSGIRDRGTTSRDTGVQTVEGGGAWDKRGLEGMSSRRSTCDKRKATGVETLAKGSSVMR